jgi:hypothetical protein
VGFAVDATREATHDNDAGRRQFAAEHPRDLRAIGRARPRPDDCDSPRPEQLWSSATAHVELPRRVEDRAKTLWKKLVGSGQLDHAASSLGAR